MAEKRSGWSSSASYGAIVVILLIPLGIIIFVVGFFQMKRRRKYTLDRNDFGMQVDVLCVLSHSGGPI